MILSYNDVVEHAKTCRYSLVECSAYKECLMKINVKDLEIHEKACSFIHVNCSYCKNSSYMRKDEL